MIAVLAATILSYAVARTITRPLATITDVMREMSATGDLTRKIALSRAASWEDEDAKLLAATFNTLTDSIARFQREAAQRERLSALGRLSTVIAHEIRNPLMIIKASLRTLASERVSRDDTRQALTDVDEEVARLNRVVNDVLDFARPIRFDYAPADVNALCADAEEATRAGHQDMHVTIDTGSGARDGRDGCRAPAHRAREHPRRTRAMPSAARPSAIAGRALRGPTSRSPRTARPNSFRITIRDRGVGVKPEDLPRVFDPYFTTKRTGSGLGLAIAKNIIEGMGGSIALDSRPGDGTEIRIDLPDSRRAGSSSARRGAA